MNELELHQKKTFDDFRHIDENGSEYWLARELQVALQYSKWENFHKVIKTAQIACKISQQDTAYHFVEINKMVDIGSGAKRSQVDYKLTRYACYLIVMNGDPRKEVIALGQTYFAVKTYAYATFQDAGYRGLYGGLSAHDIAANKGLQNGEEILDYMGSEELAANWFRITQTEAKMRRENTDTPEKANAAHYQVGTIVREAIQKAGGTMPEELPTPEKSIKELQAEQHKQLKPKND